MGTIRGVQNESSISLKNYISFKHSKMLILTGTAMTLCLHRPARSGHHSGLTNIVSMFQKYSWHGSTGTGKNGPEPLTRGVTIEEQKLEKI